MTQPNFFQSEKFARFYDLKGDVKLIFSNYSIQGKRKGLLQGLLFLDSGLKGYFSRRCIVWGGPIIDDSVQNKEEICRQLLKDFLTQVVGKAIYVEFRNLFDCSQYREVFEEFGFEFHEHLNFINLIDDEASVRKRISESKLRQIKKSLKAGAEIIVSGYEKDIRDYYLILSELYRTKVKTPLPDIDYFLSFAQNEIGVYLLIKYQDRIIGGLMGGVSGDTIYELYVCGEDGKYKDVYPSVLATYAALDYGLKNGLKYFDFLGAGKPNEDYGVREFKSKFGGELVNYGRFKLILNKPLYKIGELGVKLLKKYG